MIRLSKELLPILMVKLFFFSSSKCVNEQLKGDTIEFLFFEQSWKVSDSLELYATLILTLLWTRPTAVCQILSIRPFSGQLSARLTVRPHSIPKKGNLSRSPYDKHLKRRKRFIIWNWNVLGDRQSNEKRRSLFHGMRSSGLSLQDEWY